MHCEHFVEMKTKVPFFTGVILILKNTTEFLK